jgi:hypothetical protein
VRGLPSAAPAGQPAAGEPAPAGYGAADPAPGRGEAGLSEARAELSGARPGR